MKHIIDRLNRCVQNLAIDGIEQLNENYIITLKFLSHNDATFRQRIAISKSTDWGEKWQKAKIVYEGPSAYSQLVKINGEKLGILYESGFFYPYESIVFQSVDYK